MGWEQRQCVWGRCVKVVHAERPMQSRLLLVSASPKEGAGEEGGLGAGAGRPCGPLALSRLALGPQEAGPGSKEPPPAHGGRSVSRGCHSGFPDR